MSQVQIVLADDDADLLRLHERHLSKAGYTVVPCSNGDDAFDLVGQRQPAILLADWNMPGLTGLELCLRIRASMPASAVYIVLLTCNDAPDQVTAGFEAGADDYLVKPADRAELLARIRAGERILRLLMQQAERTAEMRRTHERTELLLTSIPSILIGVDEHGRITRWNRSAEATFGIAAAAALGKRFPECGIRWDWTLVAQQVQCCRTERQSVRPYELRFQRADGSDGILGMTVNPVQWEAGAPLGFLIVAADITERRILEGKLAQAQKLESIGQLAAGIAHEINTPTQFVGDNTRFLQDAFADLNTVLTHYDELLAAGRSGSVPEELLAAAEEASRQADLEYLLEEIPKAISQSLEGVERVTQIVRAMKDFSHPGGTEKQTADLNKAIESTITVARNEWKYVAELVTDFDPSLPPVPCLLGDFNQVILNIIVNATHAIAAVVGDGAAGKGTITVSTRRDGDWAEIRVRDTGTGIAEEHRRKVFDHFFTTKEVGRGTGQGLSLAYSVITETHGGTITFETEVGQGTTFIIRLPIEAEPAACVGTQEHEATHTLC